MQSTRGSIGFTLALATFLVAGCDAPTDASNSDPVASVVVSEASVTLERSAYVALNVSVRSTSGSVIAFPSLRFTSSAPNIASVTTAGVVQARSAGTATITVSSGAVSVDVPVTVTDADALIPAFIYADTSAITFWPGDSTRVAVTVRNKWNELIPEPAVVWTSSAPGVATVSGSGVVRAVTDGTAMVTATCGSVSRAVSIIVRRIEAPAIEGTDRLVPGAESPLRFTVFDSAARAVRAIEATWTSSDSTVLRVTHTGLAAGLRRGSAIVTATSGNASASTTIDVKPLGGTIAYRAGQDRVSFLPLDGSAPRSMVVAGGRANIALSPDGSQLAYECDTGVCVTTIATQISRTLLSGVSDPSWTADGARVAVRSGYAQMSIVPVSSGSLDVIRPGYYVMKPRISPDGLSLVFQCDHFDAYGELSDLCIAPTKGTGGALFIGNAYDAAWSPGGDSLAYVRTGVLCISLKSQPGCPGDPRRACAADVSEPAWSPDGAMLVLVRSGSLWITDGTGRTCMRLPLASSGTQPPTTPTWGRGIPPTS